LIPAIGVRILPAEGEVTDESESAAQRRLWFLQPLLEKMDPEKALDLAARMEAFVTKDGQATIRKHDHPHPAARTAPAELSAAQAGTIVRSLDHSNSAAERRPPATLKRDATGRLLNDAEMQAFMSRALQGATNRELARLFGLTPRQANGIRMGLAKRTPQVALSVAVKEANSERPFGS
jgi:hypothetical protein